MMVGDTSRIFRKKLPHSFKTTELYEKMFNKAANVYRNCKRNKNKKE